ncbi:PREDICTED: major facilitator superfamily domain-containing protein 6-like [Priapulus caudatus]|uniref:Major facilitator superfamily domain-containing protein 6-like n=1 Tax=Priapulus caudatus TaxID=37621 RepID=A0ABM1FAA3_PRICU|nr:PREDICTED: major facilitator superfamily domain-containing protein 6-like [Priapulus caudatus]XP_014681384.1 PREDICTED: major facilitator superfamily domain-containing protein 6-like [Priapulus caudatus]
MDREAIYDTDDQAYGHPVHYGQGTDVTPKQKKVRKDCFEALWHNVDRDLLISKTFYFFFFSAFGSLFPLLAIYFKQLGMNPIQAGTLIGIRPLIEFVGAPLWGRLADKFSRRKLVCLFSLFCWVAFTLAISFITPPPASCLYYSNVTHKYLEEPYVPIEKRDVRFTSRLEDDELRALWNHLDATMTTEMTTDAAPDYDDDDDLEVELQNAGDGVRRRRAIIEMRTQRPRFPQGHVIGKSPERIDENRVVNYDTRTEGSLVKPPFSTIVYRERDVREVFWLLLLLIVVGEFFCAPAITLADTATLTVLGDDVELYGRQRMFGSLGWGVAMFVIGIVLDNSLAFADHPCGEREIGEKNYTICFAVFSVLMSCAFLTATQFRFSCEGDAVDNLPMSVLQSGQTFPRHEHEAPPQLSVTNENADYPQHPSDAVSDAVSARASHQQAAPADEPHVWLTVLKTFCSAHYIAILYVVWFMGFGNGLVFTFLFWHLQDLGGTPSLFGIASVINHVSEIFAYFFSVRLIRSIGHLRVLYLGLTINIARFLYISWLKNPWWVLPFELAQGITHACVWGAICSYITQAVPPNHRPSAQGILQGLHHALGRACGAIIGGMLATRFGTQITFRGYGFASLIVLVAFAALFFFVKDRGHMSHGGKGGHEILEEATVLAPCGVPMNPMSRNLSSSKLAEAESTYQSYGAVDGDMGDYLTPALAPAVKNGNLSPQRGNRGNPGPNENKQTIRIAGNIPAKTSPHHPQAQQFQQSSDPSDPW